MVFRTVQLHDGHIEVTIDAWPRGHLHDSPAASLGSCRHPTPPVLSCRESSCGPRWRWLRWRAARVPGSPSSSRPSRRRWRCRWCRRAWWGRSRSRMRRPPPVDEAPERPAPRTTPRAPRVTRSEPQAKPADGGTGRRRRNRRRSRRRQPRRRVPTSCARPRPPTTARRRAGCGKSSAAPRPTSPGSTTRRLSASARAQHDNITRLIAQAEEALRTRSFTFARTLADKAEVLSASLRNR